MEDLPVLGISSRRTGLLVEASLVHLNKIQDYK